MHPVKPYHRKPLKGERVWTEVVRMTDIPAGDDPAQHDPHNHRTDLADGWAVMHSRGHDQEDQRGLSYLNLVNCLSGQRMELLLWPELKVPANKAGPVDPYHLSFSTLGGAHYTLGYQALDEAVAAMVEFSTYRNVFRLAVMRRGMSLCSISWLAGDKVITDIDQYHQAVSWGDCEVVLARQDEQHVDEAWLEADETNTQHMCILCPNCGETVRSLQDMRGQTVTHQCSESKLTHIQVGNDVTILMGRPVKPDLPTID